MKLAKDMRNWPYVPIQMPYDKDGKGPCSIEDAVKVVYEVWDECYVSHGTYDCLAEAVNVAMKLTLESYWS